MPPDKILVFWGNLRGLPNWGANLPNKPFFRHVRRPIEMVRQQLSMEINKLSPEKGAERMGEELAVVQVPTLM